MNVDDKNIDQLFRDAAQNKPAPQYDSAYWNDVSSVLDAEKAKRKGLLFWSLGGGAAFTIILAILFLNQSTVSPDARYSRLANNSISAEEHQQSDFQFNQRSSTKKSKVTIDSDDNSHHDLLASVATKNVDDQKLSTVDSKNLKSDQSEKSIDNRNAVEFSNETPVFAKNELFPVGSLPVLQVSIANSVSPCHIIEAKDRRWNLVAELSAGVMENYKTSRPFESGIMNFALKARYNRSGVQFSTGLGIQMSTNADLVVSRRAKFYGFGVVNHQTDLSYQNMYDIYIPVEIGYRQNKTSFGMGLQANYLVNTSMQLQSFEDNKLVKTENIQGYSNGLNKISGQGYLWLTHQLSPRLSAGVKIGTNFTNRIKEGDYFNESATTNPVFGQVSLQYNIFK